MKLTLSQRRILVVLSCGWLLLLLIRQSNHWLGPLGLSVWMGGLLIAFASLHLNPRTGLVSCFLLGLMVDAWSPLWFGLHAILFGAAQVVIGRVRHRFAAREMVSGVIVALLANLGLFLTMSFLTIGSHPGAPIAAWRILVELILSQVVLALITPWFFAVQFRGLQLVRSDLPAAAGADLQATHG